MTEVRTDERGLALSVRGHTGYAERGADIVCAAVSAICAALERALTEKSGYGAEIERSAAEASFAVRCRPAPESEEACRVLIDAAAGGLALIAEAYPQCIEIRWRRSDD